MVNPKDAVISQYRAALEMLKLAVNNCPDSLWNDPGYANKFWHIAYHTLFYAHLYLQVTGGDFKPWHKHRDQYHRLDHGEDMPGVLEPYTKDEILSYIEFCDQEMQDKMPLLDLKAESSGFSWLPFGKLELQIYNIRHIQHHTAELMEHLGEDANISIDWVGKK